MLSSRNSKSAHNINSLKWKSISLKPSKHSKRKSENQNSFDPCKRFTAKKCALRVEGHIFYGGEDVLTR